MKARVVWTMIVLTVCGTLAADCPPGDLNGDCRVGADDLLLFVQEWLTDSNTPADIDGTGYVDANDLARLAAHWGQRDCPIVINEVLAHAHAEASDWIELYNAGDVIVDLGGWFLSDTKDELERYQIPEGTFIHPHDYVVLYETTHFGSPFDPGVRVPFAFSENGEGVYLYTGDDPLYPNFIMAELFGASETNVSFGRHRKSDGTHGFVLMREMTPGRANAYPLVGPVVINEIMYHPVPNADAEYIELLNISAGPVTLFDYNIGEPWRLTDDSGIDFRFPTDEPVTIERNEHVLLVRDPAAMRQYEAPAGVKVFAWNSGKLANQGETLRLLKPGDVDDKGTRYWIEVDCVSYSDGSHGQNFAGGIDPWPTEADGSGASLNRLFPSRYGNDPNNWQATVPTPGAVND